MPRALSKYTKSNGLEEKIMTEPRDFSLVQAEDNFMREQEGNRNIGDQRPGLWPSESSVEFMRNGFKVVKGKCMRAAWYRSMQVRKPGTFKAGLAWKGDLGKNAEVAQIEKWKKMGLFVANNIKFYDRKLFVSGEMDAIIKNPLDHERHIGVEIKSFYGHYANQNICGAKAKNRGGAPKDQHFLQSAIYSYKFTVETQRLDQFRTIYLERGDGHRVEFEVGFEKEGKLHRPYWRQIPGPAWNIFHPEPVLQPYTLEDIHARYGKLMKKLKAKALPERDYPTYWTDPDEVEDKYAHGELNKGDYDKFMKNPQKNPVMSWECSYCQYTEQCDMDSA
jgi:hypothetical protein